jgi:YidC/Oxa1 family membrane protein insertase
VTIDNLRIFLWVSLLMLLWLTAQAWQQMFAPPPDIAAPSAAAPVAESVPGTTTTATPALPSLPAADASGPSAPKAVAAGADEALAPIRVRTDVLDLEIDPRGGNPRRARLLTYPVNKDQPDTPVELLRPDADAFFALQGGLRAAEGQPEANHLATFTSDAAEYTLPKGGDELIVPLRWTGANGVTVTRSYIFRRGSFAVGVTQSVTNGSPTPYQAAEYLQIQRVHAPPEQSMFDVETYSFTGPVTYNGEKYTKHDVDDLGETPFTQQVKAGWLAGIQHHFLVGAVPPAPEDWTYQGAFAGGRYTLSAIGPVRAIAPGETAEFTSRLFIGPKLQEQLKATAPGLELTVDYGTLTLLAQPLFWVLEKIHDFVGNWGVAIIICTLLIKLLFYKLSETSGRSMAGMRKLQPRMKALQERYKDDRQAMSTALMDLYKKEKINPAAGCLPMLVQIPFFIAFYWVLLESVEMRQAPFALWITDLSSKDPFFVLPLLMGAAMYFQQKLNPPPPDPVQAKMLQIMPVVFTGFFAFFPAGLVLYWLTNSVLSIAQQWRINKVLGAD